MATETSINGYAVKFLGLFAAAVLGASRTGSASITCAFGGEYNGVTVCVDVTNIACLSLRSNTPCWVGVLIGAQAADGGGQAARPPRAGEKAGPLLSSGRCRRRIGECVG